jgi:hypothetical protein
MLLRVRQWLDPLPDACRGVDITDLRSTVEHLREVLDRASSNEDLPPVDTMYQPFRMIDASQSG